MSDMTDAQEQQEQAAPRPIRLSEYRPPAYLIDSLDLDIDLQAGRCGI